MLMLKVKRIFCWLLAGSVGATLALAAETSATTNAATPAKPTFADLFPGAVVARGKGVEIKRSRLDEEVISIRGSMAGRNQDIAPSQIHLLEAQVLDRLIQIQLLVAKATDADKAKGKENCTKRLDDLRTSAGSDEALARQLRSVNTTLDQVRAKLADELTAEAVLERDLNIVVSDEEVKKYYDENPSKFEQPEVVNVSQILLSTKDPTDTTQDVFMRKDLPDDKKKEVHKRMEGLLKRARAGEDFTSLAVQYSEDPSVKDNKGEYAFTRDGALVPEFKNAAFALAATNEISDIVTTVYGYHILKLNQKIPARKVELAKVSNNVRAYLKSQVLEKKSKEYREYVDKLKKDAGVEILEPDLKLPEQTDAAAVPSESTAASAIKPAKK